MSFLYLASPYSHNDPEVRQIRFHAACRKAAQLMRDGHCVFSPIAHSHPIDLHFGAPESGDFWKRQDIPVLRHAAKLVVLTLEGWQQSKGVAWEIALANELQIPVEFVAP